MSSKPPFNLQEKDVVDVYNEENYDSIDPANRAIEAAQEWMQEAKGEKSVTIRVYRENNPDSPGKTHQPYLFAFEPSQYGMVELLDKLRDGYGSGAYWVKGYGPNGLLFNKMEEIENTERDRDAIQKEERAKLPPEDLNQLILKLDEKNNERTVALIAAITQTQQPQQPAFDMPAMMSSMIGMMVSMKQLTETGQPATNPMEMFTQAIELTKTLNPSDKETNQQDTMLEVLKQFGPAIVQGVKNLNTNQPQEKVIVGNPPNLQPIQKPQPVNYPPKPANNQNNQLQQMLLESTKMLIPRARSNSDPIVYADMFLQEVPNITLLLGQRNLIDVLGEINPEVKNYPDWFAALEEAIRNPVYEDDSLTDDPDSLDNMDNIVDLGASSIESTDNDYPS